MNHINFGTTSCTMLEDSKVKNKWVPCRHTCSRADSRIVVLCNADECPMRIEKVKRTSVTHIQYYVLSSSLSDTIENLVPPLQAAKAPLKASQSLFISPISIGVINSF